MTTVVLSDPVVQPPDRLQTLNEISHVVSATLDLGTLYEMIYEQVSRLMDTSQMFIALHTPGRDSIEVPYLREEGELSFNETVGYGENTTSLVIDRGLFLLYNTTEEYNEYARLYGLRGSIVGAKTSESGIFVPLNTGSRTIGALTVQSGRAHAYTWEDVQTLSVVASQAAVAIENARLYAQSQNSVRQMEVLLRVARMLNGSLDLPTVLQSILEGVREVMPYIHAAILLPNYATREMDIAGAISTEEDQGAGELRSTVKIPFGQGVTGTVFTTGDPLIVPDIHVHPDYLGRHAGWARSEMAVPLKRGSTVVGILDVERSEPNAFSTEDLSLLSLFASQAAIAIENARLFTAQHSRVQELQAVQAIVQKLTPLHDIQPISAAIEHELKELIDFHSCRIFLIDSVDRAIVHINPTGPGATTRMSLGEGITGWIAQHGKSLIVPNALGDSRGLHVSGTPQREESIVGAPLVYEGKVQGVITLSKLGVDQFDENSLRLLEIIAAQLAIAFDRARLYEELHAQAVTDELTRLHNRRYLLDRLREERARATRGKHRLAAIMVDIDNFKRVNDNFGHDSGDVVLRELACVIRAIARAEDVVVRYGGEEFCLLLPEISTADAETMAERLRSRIQAHVMPKGAGVRHVTVSAGVAVLSPADGFDAIFSLADDAMYEGKRRGGNRVMVAGRTA